LPLCIGRIAFATAGTWCSVFGANSEKALIDTRSLDQLVFGKGPCTAYLGVAAGGMNRDDRNRPRTKCPNIYASLLGRFQVKQAGIVYAKRGNLLRQDLDLEELESIGLLDQFGSCLAS